MLNITDHKNFLENVLTAYCMGRLTAKEVQRYVKGLGWKVSLRGNRSWFDAWCPAGTFIELNT